MKIKRFSKVRKKNFGFLGKAAGTIGITASSLLKSPKIAIKPVKGIIQPKVSTPIDINKTTSFSIEHWNMTHPKVNPKQFKKISVPKSEQLLRRKGSNLYKNTHNGFDFKSRLRSGNILSEFNRNYGNPNAAMSEMSKVTDYTSKNAPITLFQDAEEVARFKTTGNKKRLIDYMKFTDRLHNR